MSETTPTGTREILLIEGNAGDVSLIRKYFGKSKSPTDIYHVGNVIQVLPFSLDPSVLPKIRKNRRKRGRARYNESKY